MLEKSVGYLECERVKAAAAMMREGHREGALYEKRSWTVYGEDSR